MMKKNVLLFIVVLNCTILYSQEYQLVWQNCFGGSKGDVGNDIIALKNGYLIAGGTASDDGDVTSSYGNGDGWLIRTDSMGIMLWEKTYGGSDSEWFSRIIPSKDNNFYLLGMSWSSDGDISNDPYLDSPDYWIVKIDSSGNIIWDRILGGSAGEVLFTGAATLDGGVVAIGHTYSNDGDVSVHYGMADTWIVKLSSEGVLEWDYTIGTDWIDKGKAILQTSDGGYLFTSISIILEESIGNISCTPHTYGWSDGVIFKLDSNLNLQWQRCYGGSDHDGITSLLEVSDGYVFGTYVQSNDGDITGWHGAHDIWVVKIDFSGNIIWQNPIGGTRSEFTTILIKEIDDSIIVFGCTQSNNGNVSGNHSLSEHDSDIWMARLNRDGELISQQCFGGIKNETVEFGVYKKNDNNFVIAGQTNYGPSYDVNCAPHGENGFDRDIWLFEIKDCTLYAPTAPSAPAGPAKACSASANPSIYTLPTVSNQTTEWKLEPSEAGSIITGKDSLLIYWSNGYEGTVAITARGINDCGASAWSQPIYTQVETCAGISTNTFSGLKIWPNPAKTHLNIELPSNVQLPVNIQISDVSGRVVLSQNLTNQQTTLDVSSIGQGVYLLTFTNSKQVIQHKIIKE